MSDTPKTQAELNWREPIMRHFSADIARTCRVTVVADPDGLLQDDLVATKLRECGFDVLRYEDPIRFRFLYETRHRQKWDRGDTSSVVVGAPCSEADITCIPHDLLWHARQADRMLSVSLGELFKGLAVDVLGELDKSDLDALWLVRKSIGSDVLGGNQTRDYVLRAVFKLSPEISTSVEELLGQLARLHYAGRRVPAAFAARFESVAKQSGRFPDWPLGLLVASAETFFAFLQERWPRHLALDMPGAVPLPVALAVPGPADIPFDSPELRLVVDNLFVDGRLQPVHVDDASAFAGRWEQIGVQGVSTVGTAESVRSLLQNLTIEVPEPSVPPTVWTAFALRWAELTRQFDELEITDRVGLASEFEAIQAAIDSRLRDWLFTRYAGLMNRSFLPIPSMVHQIVHRMAHRLSDSDRVALIVVDGMSLSQWLTIRDAPGTDWRHDLQIDESALFAWIPTITSVSRQAIFSGESPVFFEPTILSTHAEDRHWKNFWEERGRRRDRVAFVKHGLDEPEASVIDRTRRVVDDQGATAVAIVLNSIDRLVHGVSAGASVLQASVRQWGRDGHLVSLIQLLRQRQFEVFITADHGNTEARGVGRPDVGAIPDETGTRAIVFPDENTRDAIVASNSAIAWNGVGLPAAMYVALAAGRGAFASPNAVVRSHGGVSIDEALVPFVRIGRVEP